MITLYSLIRFVYEYLLMFNSQNNISLGNNVKRLQINKFVSNQVQVVSEFLFEVIVTKVIFYNLQKITAGKYI